MDNKIHSFNKDISGIELPSQFTYPFHYVPHRLSLLAAEQVQEYLATRSDWATELQRGKMFGVLVVRTQQGEIGFIAAFSGNLAHSNLHTYFVPPVYDLLDKKGFFHIGEKQISSINHCISIIQMSSETAAAHSALAEAKKEAEQTVGDYRQFMRQAKAERDEARKNGTKSADELIAESQFQKAELKRIQQRCAANIAKAQKAVDAIYAEINMLTEDRRTRSAALQKKIFQHFVMLNALGEQRDLCDIFHDTPQGLPPAGAGECAAPKLLQYAYINHLEPLAMAEFWWGDSPRDTIRRHGHFYGACKAKCEPILNFMLQGLDVEPNELEQNTDNDYTLDVVYSDQWLLVVNKPAGMLSVPGKLSVDSLLQHVQRKYPQATGPMIVHRLDMATSGLIIFALTKDVHKSLQSMFKTRKVHKRYVAWLQGLVTQDNGVINLPLCLNPDDRPRQMVNFDIGKPAVTEYSVTARKDGRTRVLFYPQTGRTHQLRVHSAHHLGLNCPIVGDRLYGNPDTRLFLHAEAVQFEHPVTHKVITIEAPAPF